MYIMFRVVESTAMETLSIKSSTNYDEEIIPIDLGGMTIF